MKKVRDLTGLYLNIYARKNENVNENMIGADLGIVFSISGDNIEIKKAVLVQAKKGIWNGDYIYYPELKKRGKEQAVKMLNITPASVFFLYNPENICKHDKYKLLLQDHYLRAFWGSKEIEKNTVEIYKFLEEIRHFHPYGKKLYYLWGEIMDRYGVPPFFPLFPYPWVSSRIVCGWYAGILVLPATEIKAIKKLADGNVETFLPNCVSFADFMVDYFLTCYVEDSRDPVLKKAGENPDLKDRIIARGTMFINVSRG